MNSLFFSLNAANKSEQPDNSIIVPSFTMFVNGDEDGYQAEEIIENDIEKGVYLKKGDVLNFKIKGTLDNTVPNLSFFVVDGSQAAGWWLPISDTVSVELVDSPNIDTNLSIPITVDALGTDRYQLVIQYMDASLPYGYDSIKFVSSIVPPQNYTVKLTSNVTMNRDVPGDTIYQGTFDCNSQIGDNTVRKQDILDLTIKGAIPSSLIGELTCTLVDTSEAGSYYNPLTKPITLTVNSGSVDFHETVTITGTSKSTDSYKLWFTYRAQSDPGVESVTFTVVN